MHSMWKETGYMNILALRNVLCLLDVTKYGV